MPGFNQTGPFGQGPMTGRKMGRCTNFGSKLRNNDKADEGFSNEMDKNISTAQGNGFRHGFGNGRGRGGRGKGFGMGRQNRFRGGM